MRKPYPTDLSDAEWNYIEPHLPAPIGSGRPRTHDRREILNAVFYLLKSGCSWRLLPHEFPRWPTVYHYFRKWRLAGVVGYHAIDWEHPSTSLGHVWGLPVPGKHEEVSSNEINQATEGEAV